ncbi:gamma-aminobutyric acid type B receptor subunit 2 [Onthophagus taurus]|uniref:gamma-aminobutyric acid type B receptor subunit 2 n=1 Tax=Onthophagus taurus TaxID=166361 RepID=UPI000C20F9A3|nr:gamma-aminobutyric acid type B receptor subunit 2 [Onthophagus taurus]
MWLKNLLVLVVIKFCASQKPNMDNRRHDVYIAGFFPYGKESEHADTGRGVMPSVKLALDHVNEASSVLRNYRLHMWWNDTKCNAAVGVKAFFDMMHSGPHKLMLFGAACTHVTDPIAKASKRWHLTQLSYADTHPMFTKKNYPNFFRIVPSDMAFNPPRLSLLDKFNWTRVGTIYQNEPRYSLAHNRLVAELDSLGYIVVETQSFTNEVNAALSKLKKEDTRVILGNFNEYYAREIFCEAYHLEMYGRRYQWIIMGTYSLGWWKNLPENFNCTAEEMEIALEQTLLTDLLPLSTSGEITVSGITAEEYLLEYNSRRGREYSRFHGYTYDGIWAVALAIQNVAQRIKKNESVVDFRYRDANWEQLFLNALANTSFEGVTGPVRFYDNERKASILLKQFQKGSEIKVGEYNAVTNHLDLTLGDPLSWIGKHPPKDRTLRIIEHTRVNKTVYAILATLAVCGIIMAAVFLAFNIKYRNQRYIKMSSPQLNNLIIIGCMLTYTSIVFLGLDSGLSSVEAFPYICTARAWTLMAGFSLAFGAMFSKTWRVHSIFTDVKLNKKVIKDYQLFMVVGVLLFIDLVIMTTWQVADPFYRETKRLESHPHPSSEDIVIIPENEYCASEKMTIFIGSIYAYKGLLMIFGAFLAWETRHVSIPALNDSRHVGLSVYNVAIMCICGAAVALVLVDHQDAMFLIIGVFVIFCTTATLWLVFVPKMVELKRNPGGSIDKRFRPTLRPMSKTGRRDSSASELESKMKEVKAINSKFRKTLLDKENELQLLIKRLGNEARELLESKTLDSSDTNRLSVPLLRKDPASGTETTDLTSLCSISSQDCTSFHRSDSQKRRKSHSKDSFEIPKLEEPKLNGNLSPQNLIEIKPEVKQPEIKTETICNGSQIYEEVSFTKKNDYFETKQEEKTPQSQLRRRCSLKNDAQDHEENVCYRRVSVPVNRATPAKKKNECGTHVVAKSELWDTGNQHRCVKSHQKTSRSVNQEEDDTTMHRSVSERNKHIQKRNEKSPKKEASSNICNQQCNKLGYFQSTPNVAAIKSTRTLPSAIKKEKSMYNATSESELLDREILPIFQKLLTERNKSQHNIDYSFGRSCPNISIKCDIVEYL